MTDLEKLISVSGVSLIEATAINANGQVVANRYLMLSSQNSEYHAFLLTPN